MFSGLHNQSPLLIMACMTNLTTAHAHKNKRTARMVANARKDLRYPYKEEMIPIASKL